MAAREDRDGEHFRRRALILIVPVVLAERPLEEDGWAAGPFPFESSRDTADAEARIRYFHRRVAFGLYGDRKSPRRWHLPAMPTDLVLDPLSVAGAELFRFGRQGSSVNGAVILHAELPVIGMVRSLHEASRIDPGIRAACEGLLGRLGTVAQEGTRAAHLVLATPRERRLVRPMPDARYRDWSPKEQWYWLLATATSADAYPPVPGTVHTVRTRVQNISNDWGALVLRHGVAFLGNRVDKGSKDRWFPDAESYVRSVYLDAVLLGFAQRLRLSAVADNLASLGDPVRQPRRLVALEREAVELKNVYGWRQLTARSPANRLIRAYRERNEIGELEQQALTELAEYQRQAQTLANQRTNAALGLVTVVGLPFTLVLATLEVLSLRDPWPAPLLVALAVASIACAAFAFSKQGRELLRPLLSLRDDGSD